METVQVKFVKKIWSKANINGEIVKENFHFTKTIPIGTVYKGDIFFIAVIGKIKNYPIIIEWFMHSNCPAISVDIEINEDTISRLNVRLLEVNKDIQRKAFEVAQLWI